MGGFKTVPGTVLMVAGTWLVLEDLSLVQFELYRGEIPPPLTPETPTQSVRGLLQDLVDGKDHPKLLEFAGLLSFVGSKDLDQVASVIRLYSSTITCRYVRIGAHPEHGRSWCLRGLGLG